MSFLGEKRVKDFAFTLYKLKKDLKGVVVNFKIRGLITDYKHPLLGWKFK